MTIADDILSALEPHDTNTTTSDPAAGNTPRPHTDPVEPPSQPEWYDYFLASPNNPIAAPFLKKLGIGQPSDPNAPPSPWPGVIKWASGAVVVVAGVVGVKVVADTWRNL